MKILILFILTLSTSSYACRTDQIKLEFSSSSFFSSKNESLNIWGERKRTISVPFQIDSKVGCFDYSSGIDFNLKYTKKETLKEVQIYQPKVSFKKVNGRVETYAIINKQNKDIDIALTSFICTGESTLSTESYEGNISQLRLLKNLTNVKPDSRTFIATGRAAQILQENGHLSQNTKQARGRFKHISPLLENVFIEEMSKTEISLNEIENKKASLPNLIVHHTNHINAYTDESTYTTKVVDNFGCSKQFKEIMKEFHFSNLGKQLKSKGISKSVKKRKNKVTIKF